MQLLSINPTPLQTYLDTLKPFLSTYFYQQREKTKTRASRRRPGRPRVAPTWLIVALAILRIKTGLTYRGFYEALNTPENLCLLKKYGAKNIPSKTTIHRVWDRIMTAPLRNVLNQMGWQALQKQIYQKNPSTPKNTLEDLVLAVDSTGFELKQGSTWVLVKWKNSVLKKTSPVFLKTHLLIEVFSKAVLDISITKPFFHDITQLVKVLRRARVLRTGRRAKHPHTVLGDKAYYDAGLSAKLEGWGVKLVVEPKKNLKERGGDSFSERSLRLYRKSLGLWKHTFRYYRKSQVEHSFGWVKQKNFKTRAKKPENQYKHFTTLFLLYNLEILVKGGEGMKK